MHAMSSAIARSEKWRRTRDMASAARPVAQAIESTSASAARSASVNADTESWRPMSDRRSTGNPATRQSCRVRSMHQRHPLRSAASSRTRSLVRSSTSPALPGPLTQGQVGVDQIELPLHGASLRQASWNATVDTMNDSTVIFAQEGGARPPEWLVLFHQIPPKPDYFRVKVRRRLQRIGAVALKNSVYVLPRRADTREDFEWLVREIRAEGGEAALCRGQFLAGISDEEIRTMFESERTSDYAAIAEEARSLGGDDRSDEASWTACVAGWRRPSGSTSSTRRGGRRPRPPSRERGTAGRRAGIRPPDRLAPPGSPARASRWTGSRAPGSSAGSSIRPRGSSSCRPRATGPSPASSASTCIRASSPTRVIAARSRPCSRASGSASRAFGRSPRSFTTWISRTTSSADPRWPGIAALINGLVVAYPDDAERLERGAAVFEGMYAYISSGARSRPAE